LAKHCAPRYVRTRQVLSRAPIAAGATVIGLGVFGSPAQASPATPDHSGAGDVHELPQSVAGTSSASPETYEDTTDAYGRHASPAGSYTVARGDTVSRIAASLDQPWREFYQRNLEVIGADPDLILPGQVLATTGVLAEIPATGGTGGRSLPLPQQEAPVAEAAPTPPPAPAPAAAPAPAPAVEATAAPEPVAVAAASVVATIVNSAGGVAAQVQAAADTVVSTVPGAAGIALGGTRASAVDPHGHPSGLALDYMVLSDAALGDAIAQFHRDHWDELGVEYVIWQQQILTSPTGSWRPMEDRGSATANHRDHVHVNYRG
jgi:LysM repeat protein